MLKPKLEDIKIPIGDCLLKRSESGAELILDNKKSFSITLPESCILEALIKSDQTMSTKEDLIIAAWGNPEIIGPNSLPVAITNLRKVLELNNIKIINIPKKGYRIQVPEIESDSENKGALENSNSSSLPYNDKNTLCCHNNFYLWVYTGISSVALALIIFSYLYLWHTFDFVKVNINNQSEQICLTEKNELDFFYTKNQENKPKLGL